MSLAKTQTPRSFWVWLGHGLRWRYKKLQTKLKKFFRLKVVVKWIWIWNSRKPIQQDKVIFFETASAGISNSFTELFNMLVRNYELDIHCHFQMIGKVKKWEEFSRQLDFVRDAATAKYIIANDSSDLFGQMKKRRGQHFLNTWHGCGAFKRFGLGTAGKIFGDSEKVIKKYPLHPDYDILTTSSPEVEWAYVQSIGAEKHPESVKGIGVSRSDVFYQEDFIKQAYVNFYAKVPQAKGKKVILYAPTFRGRVRAGTTPNMLNLSMFYENFNDDYVLVYKYHPYSKDLPQIEPIYRDFAFDLTNMEIDTLLCVADICISDYSSLIFEYSLFERPLVSFVYDLDNYFDWRGFYYSFEEYAPGPICYTNNEMVDYILHVDERFDKEKVHAFREKFMSACDGHATERIIDQFFNGEIENFRRQTPLKGVYHDIPTTERFGHYQANLNYFIKLKQKARSAYESAARSPVDAKTVALMVDEQNSPVLFASVKKILGKKGYRVIEDIDIDLDNIGSYVASLATAGIMLCAGEPYILRMLDLREDTRVYQVCPEVLPVYPMWNNTKAARSKFFLTESREFPIHTKYDGIMSTSKGLDELYKRNYELKPDGEMIHCGNLQTDLLFGKKTKAMEGIRALIPTLEQKKIILILWENRPGMEGVLIDALTRMHERFAREYVCIIDCNDNGMAPFVLPEYFQGYAVNLVTELPKRREEQEQMMEGSDMDDDSRDDKPAVSQKKLRAISRIEELTAADIVVTDYCTEGLMAAAIGKPLILWTPDYESFGNTHDSFVNPGELLSDIRVESTTELMEKLLHIDEYDTTAEKHFAAEYLQKCDGKSAEYLVEYLAKQGGFYE